MRLCLGPGPTSFHRQRRQARSKERGLWVPPGSVSAPRMPLCRGKASDTQPHRFMARLAKHWLDFRSSEQITTPHLLEMLGKFGWANRPIAVF